MVEEASSSNNIEPSPLECADSGAKSVEEKDKLWPKFRRATWWRNAALTAWCFSPYCLWPAAIWLVANLILIGGLWFSAVHLITGGPVPLPQLLVAMALATLTLFSFGLITLWGLGIWLLRLSAYARSYMLLPTYADQRLDKNLVQSSQKEALSAIAKRTGYLAKFWLTILVFLIVPIVVFLILFSIKLLTFPALTNSMFDFHLPLAFDVALCVVLGILFIFMSENSLIGMVVSAVSTETPSSAARKTMTLSIRLFVPACMISIATLAINGISGSPQLLLSFNHPEMILAVQNPVVLILESTWQALSSVFFLTFTTAPVCELLRGHIET